LPKYAYFPFGGGPRLCIGNSFAMMETVLLLATMVQKFHLKLVPGHPVVTWPSTECGKESPAFRRGEELSPYFTQPGTFDRCVNIC